MNDNPIKRLLYAAGIIFLVSAACVMPALPRSILFDRDPQPPSLLPPVVSAHNILATTPTPTVPVGPTLTAGPRSTCNLAKFIEDVSIPDGTDLLPGSVFDKTWKVQNVGSCTWPKNFSLAFVDGAGMGLASLPLGTEVPPNGTVNITAWRLKAPIQPGNYRGYWTLKDEQGSAFPQRLIVDIDVVSNNAPAPAPRVRYDFAEHFCEARWLSGSDLILPCPGTEGSREGFVLKLPRPALEPDFTDESAGLLTHPAAQADGTIVGWFPPIGIENGDHFRTMLGCEKNARQCSVRFELAATVGEGQVITLGSWDETYDDQYSNVDLDLSSLTGKSVSFYLIVYANGDSSGDRALWLRPRILKP